MEVIEAIREVFAIEPDPENKWDVHDGWEVVTNEQTITLSISNGQSCCESWGYMLSEDNPSKFVGAELRGISLTDTNRTAHKFNPPDSEYDENSTYLDEGDVMFADIETDRGVLQFVAYNGHNGYYGHTARIVSKQLVHEVGL